MKTTLALLLLTCLALSAQTTPNGDAPVSPATTNTSVANPAAADGARPAFPAPPAGIRRARGDAGRGITPATAGAVPVPAGAIPVANPPPADVSAPVVNGPPAAPAATAPKPAEELIMAGGINLTGADLSQMLSKYAEYVGRSILRSPTLPANVNFFFVNQTPLTKGEAIQAYQALFAMNGVALIEVGDKFLKAMTVAEVIQGGQKPLIVTNAADLPELGQYVTHIVQLKYVKPTEMMPVLIPFQKMANAVYPIDSSQILVIRDFTENVKRMLEMIDKVDVAFQSEFDSEVIPIKFAKAEEIASALNALSGSGGGSATTVGTRASGAGGGGASRVGTRPGMGGYQPGAPGAMGQQGALGGANPTGTPSGGGSFSDRINKIISNAAKTSGSGEFQIIGPNKIVADVRSNSLMVFASRTDMKTIKDIISKLDIVLAQVVIETIIMDVSLDDTFSFGVSAAQQPMTFPRGNQGVGGYRTGNPFFDFLSNAATNAFPGNSTGTLPDSGFSYFARLGTGPTFDVAVKAAADDSRVNVIQKPRIQTSHATPASIFVGSTVPYVSSTYYGGGYAGGPSSSYQQLSVGIGLNVTPFINADGLVVMQIDETIDEISSYTKIDNNSVPNTSHRTISAEVAVRDGETILLGGFIRNAETKSKSGVPYLKDIPLLGALFSSRDSTKTRKELIVLMRPTVLRTPELAAMHVAVEKKQMPGVMQAEADAAREESQAVEKASRAPFDKVTPFTPEEERLYGKPPSAKP